MCRCALVSSIRSALCFVTVELLNTSVAFGSSRVLLIKVMNIVCSDWEGCPRRVQFWLESDSGSLTECTARLEQWHTIKLAVIAEDEKGSHGNLKFSDNLKRVTINNRLGTELVCKPDKPSATSMRRSPKVTMSSGVKPASR